MTIDVRVTEYTVCALPEDHIDAYLFSITVAYRAAGRWAVLRGQRCLGSDGTWDFEPIPSDRTDEWKALHRFDERTALKLARDAAPKVAVNGWTVDRVMAETNEKPDRCTWRNPVTQPEQLTGSDYVRAVVAHLVALDVPVDGNALDLDEEQCNIPIANFDEIVWLRWLDDPEHGWHFADDSGRRCAPICAPDTPPGEAARILADYV